MTHLKAKLAQITLSFLLFHHTLSSEIVNTFYGALDVQEPVLLELIESPSFTRLKSVRQYGVVYYTEFPEEYTRYDHSLGVFHILRVKGASLKEQIAGLLHDASHTAFSHVGDWIFDKIGAEKDYQNSIHVEYLERSGLATILGKYGYTAEEMQPVSELYPMLEQKGPALCADRIEYNIQGAYHQGFITREEAAEILDDFRYIDGDWIATDLKRMKKLVSFSLYMTEHCWGGVNNYLASRWLAESILRAVELGILTWDAIHFGVDEAIWLTLFESPDPEIQARMRKILDVPSYFILTDEADADLKFNSKFRGINPWVLVNGKKVRLLETDFLLHKAWTEVQERVQKGWSVKLIDPLAEKTPNTTALQETSSFGEQR
ncbi:HD domain-containing protein [Estrella lausannensis]|uniref:Metal dependent phosphohydrolase n=1 Tax=Estrella lausannensis TaxID=483423 RepID=A0A0H5DRA2_9BACT|nr:HD domain-containing protein [Estrella lausannensis]CRX39216.1 Metal dependent phosphohydrolase [Estrella lausannensis]